MPTQDYCLHEEGMACSNCARGPKLILDIDPILIKKYPWFNIHVVLSVEMLWAAEDHGQVEAVAGPYQIFDASFRTLHESNWLADDVRD